MTRILRRQKPEDAEGILEEICKKIHTDYVAPTSIDLKAFKTLIGDTSNMFHGILYQAFAEEIRTELDMNPKEFYNLYGSIAAIVDPTFKENAHLPIPVILWSVSVYNRGKNSVTDVREISTKLVKREGIKYRQSLVERVVLPGYADDLMKLFSFEDAGQLLLQDFWTTEGVYQGLAKYKGSEATLQLVDRDHEIEKPEVFYRHWKKILEFIAKKKDGIEKKTPFLEDQKYQTELYTADHGFPVPLYARYLVEYQRTRKSKKREKKSFADGMEINLMTNAKVFQVQTQAATELERRVRDAEEHVKEMQSLLDGFGHDVGNSVSVVEANADHIVADLETASYEDGSYRMSEADFAELSASVNNLHSNAVTLQRTTSGGRLLSTGKIDEIRAAMKPLNIEELIREQVPSEISVYNKKLQRSMKSSAVFDESDYIPIEYEFNFSDYDGNNMSISGHEGLMRSIVTNITRNALKYLTGIEKPMIKYSLNVIEDNYLELIVSDNGHGTSQEMIETIRAGDQIRTGQGISRGIEQVRRITELHGGQIDVESAPEQGFTIKLKLPYEKKEVKTAGVEEQYYF
jgi:signal transduction histidine kinase